MLTNALARTMTVSRIAFSALVVIALSGAPALGQNPPEIAYWERGEWWLAGDSKPWHPEAVTVVSERLVFKPRLAPVA